MSAPVKRPCYICGASVSLSEGWHLEGRQWCENHQPVWAHSRARCEALHPDSDKGYAPTRCSRRLGHGGDHAATTKGPRDQWWSPRLGDMCPLFEPVRVEEPAGEPDEDLYLEHTEHRIAEMSGERVAQSANADVRELANTVRERLQKGERDAELLEGREHSFTPWRRAYMALDEIADLARREASLPVPVGDETEALRAALDALRDAAEGWPTPNFYTDAADAGEKALARVAGLEAREARLRRAAEDAIEAYEGDRTESQAFRAALDRLRVAVAALPSGEDAF